MEIKNKTAIVTGGASGLGEAVIKRLHRLGAKTIIADMNEAKGQSLASDLGSAALFCKTDVTNTKDVEACVRMASERFGGVHILVNCAGAAYPMRVVSKKGPHDLDVFIKIIQINLVGTFDFIRQCAWAMQNNDPNEDGERGVIINTASAAGHEGQIGQASYSASKAAIIGMTLTLARDLASLGIRNCSISPGNFDTPLFDGLPDDYKKGLMAQTPFPNRFGRPDEFAALVQQIVENSMLNGETIRLDGALRLPPKY